ncbi:hypothetical protein lbkm_2661 [Lachnospiraceae bacterium KM106-2]|nr:hypothetical protein lbkm_2661 [Lachnospiraceae bacterium KM106-2]
MTTMNYNINNRPFDDSASEHRITMYDHLPYQTNRDICNKNHIRLFSGNLVKSYSYSIDPESKMVSNHDEEVSKLVQEIQQRTE